MVAQNGMVVHFMANCANEDQVDLLFRKRFANRADKVFRRKDGVEMMSGTGAVSLQFGGTLFQFMKDLDEFPVKVLQRGTLKIESWILRK